jgi:hypothetical protein
VACVALPRQPEVVGAVLGEAVKPAQKELAGVLSGALVACLANNSGGWGMGWGGWAGWWAAVQDRRVGINLAPQWLRGTKLHENRTRECIATVIKVAKAHARWALQEQHVGLAAGRQGGRAEQAAAGAGDDCQGSGPLGADCSRQAMSPPCDHCAAGAAA